MLAAVDRVRKASARTPLRLGDHRLDEHVMPMVVFNGLSQHNDAAYGDFAQGVRDMLRASQGQRVTPSPWLAGVLEFTLTGTDSPYGSAQTAILCGDGTAPRDPEVYWRDVQRGRAQDPLFAPVTHNINPCAFWDRPRERPTTIRDDLPPLLVNATGDPRTDHEGARTVRGMWPSSRLVTLSGADQHAVYGVYGERASTTHGQRVPRDGPPAGEGRRLRRTVGTRCSGGFSGRWVPICGSSRRGGPKGLL
ncbi:hypothetical protein GCM10011428_28790 [Streptomyces violaceus]|uniref:alpha/beta hydrolase n=1 Tax=Streptomyces violaceus TaxID=1936 RepID=UPI003386E1EE